MERFYFKAGRLGKFKDGNKAAFLFLVVFINLFFHPPITAQNTAPGGSPQATAAPTASPTPIPFSDIIEQSDQATATLTAIGSDTTSNAAADRVERELPVLTEEINVRLEETARAVENRTSLERLSGFENEWRTLTKKLSDWRTDLTGQARKLEMSLTQLADLEKKWRMTADELTGVEAPPEVTTRIQNILGTIVETRRQVEAQQARIVGLQDRVAEQQKRVDQAVASLRQTRSSLVGQLLVEDNPPIWSRELWSNPPPENRLDIKAVFAAQAEKLSDFAARNQLRMIVHLLIFATLAGVLTFLRRRVRRAVETDASLENAAVIFYFPISTALVLAILFNSYIYQQTPQILGAIFGAILFVPATIILRKLVEKPLYPILYSLVVFFFIDLVRGVIDAQTTVARLIFLAEMLGGFIFFLFVLRTRLSLDPDDEIRNDRVFRTFKAISSIALPIFAVAFLANAFGYLGLAQLLGNAVLRSSYAALILYAIVRIVDGLIIFALRFEPLCRLKMVERHRLLIQQKIRGFLRFIAAVFWIVITLEFLTLREPVFEFIRAILTAELSFGSIGISLGDVVLFAVTVWAAFKLARFVNFALEEDVYPRFALERGLPYAISTLLKYTILLAGFFLAVAGAGFDLSRFTILAGAFGVGIGFGLQNIINNFVSGLILLFERPVKVGDQVRIGDVTGTVRNIGIRASVVHVWDNSDIIVPNSKLISDNVTNFTYSSQQRGIEIVFSVPPAEKIEPKKIIGIMEESAEKHPLVLADPPPQVLFDEVSFDRRVFRLRVWTDYFDKVLKIRSDLVLNISEALTAENIPHEEAGAETPS